ncbi:MAG: P-II family nitrogen regulator [Elusimicrobiales bacterium]
MSSEYGKAVITIVVQRRHGSAVVEAALALGAEGVTYFYARGTGLRQKLGFLGRLIDAEKQVVLLAVPADKASDMLDLIIKKTGLDKPGHFFAFIQPASRVVCGGGY